MKNIILIGFMGCGKSSLGRFLGRKGYHFVDTDDIIVQKENRSINDIFATDGEAYFRELETKVLKELCEQGEKNLVISVGGGLPVKEENRELLHELGKVVYLRTTVETLVKRLSGDKKRPLLQNGNIETRIRELMEQRKDIYEDVADIILDTDNRSFEMLYAYIRKAVR